MTMTTNHLLHNTVMPHGLICWYSGDIEY